MQVKKFEAPTMQEALKVIKRELGPEAIILSTKHIKSGFGLMSKASVEITAAIAEKDLKKKNAAEKDLPQALKEKIWNGKATKQSEIYNDYFEKQLRKAGKDKVEITGRRAAPQSQAMPGRAQSQAMPGRAQSQARPGQEQQQQVRPTVQQQLQRRAAPAAQAQPPAISRGAGAPATNGIQERRYIDIGDDDEVAPQPTARRAPAREAAPAAAAGTDRVRNLEADIEQLKSMIGELASGATSRETARDEADPELSDALMKTMQDLVSAGVEKKLARQLVKTAAFELNSGQLSDEHMVQERVATQLMEEIKVSDLLQGVGATTGKSTSTVIAMVGPTGVGKTTTIAKIASLAMLEKKLRVGLINLDSYKVAAADQLSTYSKIMNVPFRSVNTKEELSQAIYDFSSLDLVLIDTTGRSQKDQESLLQLRHLLGSIEGAHHVLMISATTKDSDIHEVVSRFRIFNPVGMVFSKLDETSVYGCIYNVQKRCGLPLLYFTVGQRVPEDIEKASGERVVDLILDL